MKLDNRLNAMTVDVEDYFQVSAFEGVIDKKDWDSISLRVGDNTNRLLDLFAKNNVKSTFFTLGWVAQRCPDVIKRIVNEGHELASHGLAHQRATTMSEEEFREDVKEGIQRSKFQVKILTDDQAILIQDGKTSLIGKGKEIIL